MIFQDRSDAGRQLALALDSYQGRKNMLVLGLPRGGVPVAFEVAVALHAPLDIFVVRKIGTPGQEELAMGAVASGGTTVVNDAVVETLHIPPDILRSAAARELARLEVIERELRGDRPSIDVSGKTIILVDDGLATGSTMSAAIAALQSRTAAAIVAAVPVSAASTLTRIQTLANEVVCLYVPDDFYAVGEWYNDFSQTTDAEVRDYLDRALTSTKSF